VIRGVQRVVPWFVEQRVGVVITHNRRDEALRSVRRLALPEQPVRAFAEALGAAGQGHRRRPRDPRRRPWVLAERWRVPAAVEARDEPQRRSTVRRYVG
jgi:hypothetical protein